MNYKFGLCPHGLQIQECFLCNFSEKIYPPIKLNRDRRFDRLDSIMKEYPKIITEKFNGNENEEIIVSNFKLNPYVPISELRSQIERRYNINPNIIYEKYANNLMNKIKKKEDLEFIKLEKIENIESKFIETNK